MEIVLIVLFIALAVVGAIALAIMHAEGAAKRDAYALLDDPQATPNALRSAIKRLNDTAGVTRSPEVATLIAQLQQRLMDRNAGLRKP